MNPIVEVEMRKRNGFEFHSNNADEHLTGAMDGGKMLRY